MAVGQNVLRKEGHDKLTGPAKYIDDLVFEGMLYGKTIRSTVPHATIESIAFDPSFDWSSVVVADHRDIPGDNVVALIESDQPLLAAGKVLHCEEPILLIAAEDKQTLEEAARNIHIQYKPLPAVFTIEEALAGQQLIYGEDNIFKRFLIGRGDISEGFERADVIVEGEYRVPHQEQLYIEPQGIVAIPGENSMTVMGSMQCPYYVHKALKRSFKLDDHQAIVIQTTT